MSGASPVVDTQSVAARRVVTKDVIDALPTGKNWNGIGQLTVGVVSNQVDVGGSSGEQQNQVSIHGGSYTDNIRTLDGMMLSNFACAYSCTGLSANDSSTQELSYDVGALSAEVAGGGIRITSCRATAATSSAVRAFGSIATNEFAVEQSDAGVERQGHHVGRLDQQTVGQQCRNGRSAEGGQTVVVCIGEVLGTQLYRSNDYYDRIRTARIYVPDLSRQAIDDQMEHQLRRSTDLAAVVHAIGCRCYYNYAPRATPHWRTTSLRPP